jgi:hypothetical protein
MQFLRKQEMKRMLLKLLSIQVLSSQLAMLSNDFSLKLSVYLEIREDQWNLFDWNLSIFAFT